MTNVGVISTPVKPDEPHPMDETILVKQVIMRGSMINAKQAIR